jgi:hypothetical protein
LKNLDEGIFGSCHLLLSLLNELHSKLCVSKPSDINVNALTSPRKTFVSGTFTLLILKSEVLCQISEVKKITSDIF